MSETFEWIEQNGSAVAAWNGGTCRVSGTEWEFCEDNKPRTSGVGLNYENAKTRCEELWKHRGTIESPVFIEKPKEQPSRTPGENVLMEADKVAGESRSRDYGHPKVNHDRIARLWNGYFAAKGERITVNAVDVATLMILLKIARNMNGYKHDSAVDMAGYTKCLAMIHEAEAANRNGINGPHVGE